MNVNPAGAAANPAVPPQSAVESVPQQPAAASQPQGDAAMTTAKDQTPSETQDMSTAAKSDTAQAKPDAAQAKPETNQPPAASRVEVTTKDILSDKLAELTKAIEARAALISSLPKNIQNTIKEIFRQGALTENNLPDGLANLLKSQNMANKQLAVLANLLDDAARLAKENQSSVKLNQLLEKLFPDKSNTPPGGEQQKLPADPGQKLADLIARLNSQNISPSQLRQTLQTLAGEFLAQNTSLPKNVQQLPQLLFSQNAAPLPPEIAKLAETVKQPDITLLWTLLQAGQKGNKPIPPEQAQQKLLDLANQLIKDQTLSPIKNQQAPNQNQNPNPTPTTTANSSPGLNQNASPNPSPGLNPNATPNLSPGPNQNANPNPSPGLNQNIAPNPSPSPNQNATPNPSPGLNQNITPNPSPSPNQNVTPNPSPGPNQNITPNPSPGPNQNITPNPSPSPNQNATPNPSPVPNQNITPNPSPGPNQNITPNPSPAPNQNATPNPSPGPNQNTTPNPSPGFNPSVTPNPNPGPNQTATPNPSPGFNPSVTPNPNPGSTQNAPANPSPSPNPGATPNPSPNLNPSINQNSSPGLNQNVTPSPGLNQNAVPNSNPNYNTTATINPNPTPTPTPPSVFAAQSQQPVNQILVGLLTNDDAKLLELGSFLKNMAGQNVGNTPPLLAQMAKETNMPELSHLWNLNQTLAAGIGGGRNFTLALASTVEQNLTQLAGNLLAGNISVGEAKDGLDVLMSSFKGFNQLGTEEEQLARNFLRRTLTSLPPQIEHAAVKYNMPELPRAWLLTKLANLDACREQAEAELKLAAANIRTLSSAMQRSAVTPVIEHQSGNSVLSFTTPLYFGEGQAYPAHIHIYQEYADGGSPFARRRKKPETWVRITVDTENIGPVDTFFRLYDQHKLDIRVRFQEPETAAEFGEYLSEIRRSMKDSPLELTDLSVRSSNS